jgi:hypothetical protein
MLLAGALAGFHLFKKTLNDFTDTSPVTLPTVKMSPDEMAQVRRRVDEFRTAVRGGLPAPPLALTADEINALIATDPDLQALKGKLYATIEGDQIKGQVSVPVEEAGLPMFKGRYLNGSGIFNLSLHNGILRLTAQTVSVKGKPLPEVYLQNIRKQNLAKKINSDPRDSVALDHLESIDVKDGKIVIVPKQGP